MAVPVKLRQQVIERAERRCEYCQTQQDIVIEMQIDHIKPESTGGETILANLCLACITCNAHKQAAQSAVDPQTGSTVPLFNPRQDRWDSHFQWSADKTRLEGLTPVGRATIERLQMNADPVVAARKRWVRAGWHPPT